jgi:hypothetical protein
VLLGYSNPAYDQAYERPGIVMFDIRLTLGGIFLGALLRRALP